MTYDQLYVSAPVNEGIWRYVTIVKNGEKIQTNIKEYWSETRKIWFTIPEK